MHVQMVSVTLPDLTERKQVKDLIYQFNLSTKIVLNIYLEIHPLTNLKVTDKSSNPIHHWFDAMPKYY